MWNSHEDAIVLFSWFSMLNLLSADSTPFEAAVDLSKRREGRNFRLISFLPFYLSSSAISAQNLSFYPNPTRFVFFVVSLNNLNPDIKFVIAIFNDTYQSVSTERSL